MPNTRCLFAPLAADQKRHAVRELEAAVQEAEQLVRSHAEAGAAATAFCLGTLVAGVPCCSAPPTFSA